MDETTGGGSTCSVDGNDQQMGAATIGTVAALEGSDLDYRFDEEQATLHSADGDSGDIGDVAGAPPQQVGVPLPSHRAVEEQGESAPGDAHQQRGPAPHGEAHPSQRQQRGPGERRHRRGASTSGAGTSRQLQQQEQQQHQQRPQTTTHQAPFKLRSEELHARYAARFAERVAAERAASEALQRRQRSVAYLRQQLDEEYAAAVAAAARAPATPTSRQTPTRPEPFRLAIDGRMGEWHSRHPTLVSTEEMELKQAEEEQQRLRRQLHDARAAARAVLSAAPPTPVVAGGDSKAPSARVQTALPVTVAQPFRLEGAARSAQYRQRWRERLKGEREAEAARLRAASSHCAPGSSGARSRLMASAEEYVRRARSFAGDGGRESTTSSTLAQGGRRHGKHGGGGGGLARSQSLCHTCGRDRRFRALPMPDASIPPFRPDPALAAPATRPRPPALATEARLGAKSVARSAGDTDVLPQHTPVLLSGDGHIEAYATTLRCPTTRRRHSHPRRASLAAPRGGAGDGAGIKNGGCGARPVAAQQQVQQQQGGGDDSGGAAAVGTDDLDVEGGALSPQNSLQVERRQQQHRLEEEEEEGACGWGDGDEGLPVPESNGGSTHRDDERFVDADDD